MLSTLSRGLSASRTARTAALLSTLVLAAACDDDHADHEPDIESVRLVIASPGGAADTYTVTANGATPSPVRLRVGTSTITAVPLEADGHTIDEAGDFELRMEGLPAGVTFTRSGSLTATISATAAVSTPTTARAVMWHKTEQHDDYTAVFPMTVAP